VILAGVPFILAAAVLVWLAYARAEPRTPGLKSPRREGPVGSVDRQAPTEPSQSVRQQTVANPGHEKQSVQKRRSDPAPRQIPDLLARQMGDPDEIRGWLADVRGWLLGLRSHDDNDSELYERDMKVYRLRIYLMMYPDQVQRLIDAFPGLGKSYQMELSVILGRLPIDAARDYLFSLAENQSLSLSLRVMTVHSLGQNGELLLPELDMVRSRLEPGYGKMIYRPSRQMVRGFSKLMNARSIPSEVRAVAAMFLGEALTGIYSKREEEQLQPRKITSMLAELLRQAPKDSKLEAAAIIALCMAIQHESNIKYKPELSDPIRVANRIWGVFQNKSAPRRVRRAAFTLYGKIVGEDAVERYLALAETTKDPTWLGEALGEIQPQRRYHDRIERLIRRNLLGPDFNPRNGALAGSLLHLAQRMGAAGAEILKEIAHRTADQDLKEMALARLRIMRIEGVIRE